MSWTNIKEFFSDVKVIGAGLLMLWAGTVFALDTRYLTLTGYASGTVKQLQREVAEIRIRLQYATSDQQRQMLKALIIIKEQQILEVK